jgi:hypothetical protein
MSKGGLGSEDERKVVTVFNCEFVERYHILQIS